MASSFIFYPTNIETDGQTVTGKLSNGDSVNIRLPTNVSIELLTENANRQLDNDGYSERIPLIELSKSIWIAKIAGSTDNVPKGTVNIKGLELLYYDGITPPPLEGVAYIKNKNIALLLTDDEFITKPDNLLITQISDISMNITSLGFTPGVYVRFIDRNKVIPSLTLELKNDADESQEWAHAVVEKISENNSPAYECRITPILYSNIICSNLDLDEECHMYAAKTQFDISNKECNVKDIYLLDGSSIQPERLGNLEVHIESNGTEYHALCLDDFLNSEVPFLRSSSIQLTPPSEKIRNQHKARSGLARYYEIIKSTSEECS